jgi:hypothetical protein
VVVRTPSLHLRWLPLVGLLLLVGACVESGWTACSDGRLCPPGRVCDVFHGTCSSPEEECLERTDRTECAGGARICMEGRCIDSCGDGMANGSDECEGADVLESTCAARGFYEGELACRSDCTFDLSGCSGACMDGQVDESHELCDATDFGSAAGATCVSQGFDAGRQGCASDCQGFTNDPCIRFGWTSEEPVTDDTGPDALTDMWGTREDLFILASPGGVLSAGQGWVPVGGDGGDAIRGRALWAGSADDIWVIDSAGDGFLHWDGATWSDVESPAGGLRELWGSTGSSIFAVGDQGAVVHFDGTGWTTQRTPGATGTLRAVWGVSADEVYAAGEAGSLIRFDGAGWSAIESGTEETLAGVWARSESEIWTVGPATVRRFDGDRWTVALTFDRESDGRAWIGGNGASDVWVAGGADGTVRRYDGTRWSDMLTDNFAPEPLWVDPTAVTAGYQYGAEGGSGTVRRWFGAGTGPALVPEGAMLDAWALDPNVWIAVGFDESTGDGLAVMPNGPLLDRFLFPDLLEHVVGFGPDRIYAGGGDRILHYDGAGWTEAFSQQGMRIVDMWTGGPEDVYALDSTFDFPSRIFHFDGETWTEIPPPEPQCGEPFPDLIGGWASGPDDVFVIGRDVLARYDGQEWSYFNPPTCSNAFESIWGSGRDDVWTFEESRDSGPSHLHHWDGSEWTSQVTNGSGKLVGTAADDVFLGTSAHYDGRVWSPINSIAVIGAPVFALPSRLFMVDAQPKNRGLGQFVRTRFWHRRAAEAGCTDGVDDDADGATDRDDDDCAAARREDP